MYCEKCGAEMVQTERKKLGGKGVAVHYKISYQCPECPTGYTRIT